MFNNGCKVVSEVKRNRYEVFVDYPILIVLQDDEKVVGQIKKFKRLFLRFTHENQKAQKYLMGGIEKTVEARKDELLPKVIIMIGLSVITQTD